MIDRAALTSDLRKQVLTLEGDLRRRIGLPEFDQPWREEHARAASGERTGATYTAWAEDRITQAAVSWVLTSAFVRFCEDNRLLAPVWISGPAERRQEALDAQLQYFRANPEHTDREWLLQAIEHLAATPATAGLVDDQAMLHTVSPSGPAVTTLLAFWRERDADGNLVHDLTDEDLDTRFLGDLYQDLSEHAKKTYALLQTPEFVESFILDRTLTPALDDRPLEGFKLIDPACGSGHFLLGAFDRILDRWQREAPALGTRERIQKTLDAVWGVDINPFAADIAIFRLTVAALKAEGKTSLENASGFTVNVLSGDSLWFSHDQDGLISHENDFAYSTEHRDALIKALARGQYDAVVANPPYITVKDKALNAGYRQRYNHLKGKYQLTAPFMELLFKLAKRGEPGQPAGWVGQITSNAFMKREFGVPMIEDLLAKLDLRLVVDTSGAYLPGHGTPTVILVGRNQDAPATPIRAVLGIRGEPGRPERAEEGMVWAAIVENVDLPGTANQWLSVEELDRHFLEKHPWSLSGGGVSKVVTALESQTKRLHAVVDSVGITSFTLEDDAFLAPEHSMITQQLPEEFIRWMVLGDGIRDWDVTLETRAVFPYLSDFTAINPNDHPSVLKWLWPRRTNLSNNVMFGGITKTQSGLSWIEYGRLTVSKLTVPFSITFAEVTTHNHFVLDRGGKVFKQTAPVIKLPADATEDDHLRLLGVLNSSTACFWLKQNCFNKGRPGAEAAGADEPWEHRFQFNATTVQDFPLPKSFPLERARRLDSLAQVLSSQQVSALVASATPTRDLLEHAEVEQARLRELMIAEQEELDWEVYASYGLLDEALTYPGEAPRVRPSERAFAIVLARAVEAGEVETSWFKHWNHQFPMVTEIPSHWPEDYRALVQRRIEAMAQVPAIGLLEAPEFKRRWSTEPFAKQADEALRGWLLDRLEDRRLWFDRQGRPTPRSVSQLADELGRDAEFRGVVELWKGVRDVPLASALTELLDTEAVPYLAALRLKDSGLRKFAEWQHVWDLQRQEDAGRPAGNIPVPPKYTSADFRKASYWSARGKLDVPKERFIAYPGAGRETDPTALLGWAGWDHAQQSLALAIVVQQRRQEGAPDERLIPLVAGMAELQPWVAQWHQAVDPNFGISPADFLAEQLRGHLHELGKTAADLEQWRPEPATRGRRARG